MDLIRKIITAIFSWVFGIPCQVGITCKDVSQTKFVYTCEKFADSPEGISLTTIKTLEIDELGIIRITGITKVIGKIGR